MFRLAGTFLALLNLSMAAKYIAAEVGVIEVTPVPHALAAALWFIIACAALLISSR